MFVYIYIYIYLCVYIYIYIVIKQFMHDNLLKYRDESYPNFENYPKSSIFVI